MSDYSKTKLCLKCDKPVDPINVECPKCGRTLVWLASSSKEIKKVSSKKKK